jgi:hypothetical protein
MFICSDSLLRRQSTAHWQETTFYYYSQSSRQARTALDPRAGALWLFALKL